MNIRKDLVDDIRLETCSMKIAPHPPILLEKHSSQSYFTSTIGPITWMEGFGGDGGGGGGARIRAGGIVPLKALFLVFKQL